MRRINSLMAEVLEDHIRLHMLSPEKRTANTAELAEDLIDLVRASLKQGSGRRIRAATGPIDARARH